LVRATGSPQMRSRGGKGADHKSKGRFCRERDRKVIVGISLCQGVACELRLNVCPAELVVTVAMRSCLLARWERKRESASPAARSEWSHWRSLDPDRRRRTLDSCVRRFRG
jgi:hypothetical protein